MAAGAHRSERLLEGPSAPDLDHDVDTLSPGELAAWRALCEIPYGETRSYRDLAIALGKPTAVRAVGAANGANPLPIVVPCHRVIGANGSLVGYGGGLALKKRLLDFERAPKSWLF